MKIYADRYDVAVLKLSRPVAYRDNILPICLPTPGKDYEGALGVVAGWGKTDTSFGECSFRRHRGVTRRLQFFGPCQVPTISSLLAIERSTNHAALCALSLGKTGTNLLQKVYVPILNNRMCYAWHELKDIILELHDEMFCAGHEQGKMDACLVSITRRPKLCASRSRS